MNVPYNALFCNRFSAIRDCSIVSETKIQDDLKFRLKTSVHRHTSSFIDPGPIPSNLIYLGPQWEERLSNLRYIHPDIRTISLRVPTLLRSVLESEPRSEELVFLSLCCRRKAQSFPDTA